MCATALALVPSFVLCAVTALGLEVNDPQRQVWSSVLIVAVNVVVTWSFRDYRMRILAFIATAASCIAVHRRSAFSTLDLTLAASQLAILICLLLGVSYARRELDQARCFARLDDLTGLPNRQAILEAIDAELCRARRFGRPFSVALLDCDGFKAINDQQGHLAGDRALQKLAAALRIQTRAYDCVGRLGGDEFVLILSEAGADQVPAILERLRAAVQQELSCEYPSLSFSIGVTTIQPPLKPIDATLDRFECLNLADQAMYAAKRSGTNQTRFSPAAESATQSAEETHTLRKAANAQGLKGKQV